MGMDLAFVLRSLAYGAAINEWFHWRYFVTFGFGVYGAGLIIRSLRQLFYPWVMGESRDVMFGMLGIERGRRAHHNTTVGGPRVPRPGAEGDMAEAMPANHRRIDAALTKMQRRFDSLSV